MATIDYKEKYMQALERARQFSEKPYLEDSAGIVEYIFPELKESEDERIRKELIEQVVYIVPNDDEVDSEGNVLPTYQKRIDKYLAWLEKQEQKQKLADNVKPKFKVGDWIINSFGTLRLIEEINWSGYRTDGGWLSKQTYENNFHLWTIQYAKDGDVLATKAGGIFIYKELLYPFAYCGVDKFGVFKDFNCGDGLDWTPYLNDVTPATKEQRDLLFQKMKESGCEWDAEKKELKKIEQKLTIIIPKFRVGDEIKTSNEESLTITKIDEKGYWSEDLFICGFDDADKWELVEQKPADEVGNYDHKEVLQTIINKQKPAWSEEDENINECIQWTLIDKQVKEKEPNKYNREINWLKSLKDRVQPQPKQEWSEEDEHRINDTIYFLETAKKHYASTVELDACIDWLKSLRHQSHWKPSDEQIEALESACDEHWEPDGLDPLYTLYQDLKKLREE